MTSLQPPSSKPSKPFVTWGLCLVMLVVWVAEIIRPELIQTFAFVPALGLFEPWRFLTAAFLHSTPMPFHLAFNCWALWVVGRALEPVIGHIKLAAAFVIFAIGAMLAQCLAALIAPNAWITFTVGASGAVFGFFGMVLAIQKVLQIPASEMAALIGINFALGFFLPNVAWVAHLGGLLVGFLLGAYTGWTLRHGKFVEVNLDTPDSSSDSLRGLPTDDATVDQEPDAENRHSAQAFGQYSPASGTPTPDDSKPIAPSSNRHFIRVVSTSDRLRNAGVYLTTLALLIAGNWAFYHFNYQTIYKLLGLTS